MPIPEGTRLGPYEILVPLGAGGMGEVYRARDTRLDRTVAIKVLPAHLSSKPELRQRLEREARAVSSLQHPHICVLYDIGHQDGTDFLVMEYLEGETLAARVLRGPLGLEELLRYGMEISDALDKAHRQGLVHRDLKPGNIMLTKSGSKLLDFGLAKATGHGGASSLSSAPTASSPALGSTPSQPLTAEGRIVGTYQYMSPEQLEGRDADARSDIFALGAVLYEMATGRKAFEGKSQATLIAAIMDREPPAISQVAPMSPPALDRVVKTCLAKDPDKRWQTAHDVKLQLEWIAEAGSQAGVPAPVTARRKVREQLLWAVAAVALIVAGAGLTAAWYFRSEARLAARPFRAQILPPEKTAFDFIPTGAPVAVSPDGQRIVFGARDSSGKRLLWVRSLDALTAQPLAGTEGAAFPFWAPDSRTIGFFAGGSLKKIEASGGPVLTLCPAADGRGGTWNRDEVIVFTPAAGAGLFRVSSSGGTPTQMTKPTGSANTHRWPHFLPDGRHFLYTTQAPLGSIAPGTGIYAGSLDSTEGRQILPDITNAAYAPPGYLFFWRQGHLMVQPFDAKSLKVTGDAFPLAEQVQYARGYSMGVFSVSHNGVLVYQSGSATSGQLRWLDANGKETGTGTPGGYFSLRLSPDGTRLAEAIVDVPSGNVELWLLDVARNVPAKFTFERGINYFPVWSPDSTRIAYASNTKSTSGVFDIYVKPASGATNEEPLVQGKDSKRPTDWSHDGRYLAYQLNDGSGKTGWDIWILPLFGDAAASSGAGRKPFPFAATEFNELAAVFSPDGRWLAYQSDESGTFEIYVAPFPGPGGKSLISTGGGRVPAWSKAGKQLFYVGPDDRLMATDVRLGVSSVQVLGTPRPLFPARLPAGLPGGRSYDVGAGARKFVVVQTGEAQSEPLTLVVNWTATLKK